MSDSGLFSNIVAKVVEAIVFAVVLATTSVLWLVAHGYENYPTATRAIVWVFIFYVGYKAVKRIVKLWIRMFFMGLKLFVFVATVGVFAGLYLRGVGFFTRDVPQVFRLVSDREHLAKSAFWGLFPDTFKVSMEDDDEGFAYNFKKMQNEYGIEIDESYIDYMNSNYKQRHHKVDVSDFDIEHLAENLRGIFGNV